MAKSAASGGEGRGQQAGEGRTPGLGAGSIDEPFAQAQEVDGQGRQDVRQVRPRQPDVAGPPQPTAADPARESPLDARPLGVRRREVAVGFYTLAVSPDPRVGAATRWGSAVR